MRPCRRVGGREDAGKQQALGAAVILNLARSLVGQLFTGVVSCRSNHRLPFASAEVRFDWSVKISHALNPSFPYCPAFLAATLRGGAACSGLLLERAGWRGFRLPDGRPHMLSEGQHKSAPFGMISWLPPGLAAPRRRLLQLTRSLHKQVIIAECFLNLTHCKPADMPSKIRLTMPSRLGHYEKNR